MSAENLETIRRGYEHFIETGELNVELYAPDGLEVEGLHDAGEKVVAVLRQRGRSKATGLPVDMHFAQVWTLRAGRQARMEMYADPVEALAAAGLA